MKLQIITTTNVAINKMITETSQYPMKSHPIDFTTNIPLLGPTFFAWRTHEITIDPLHFYDLNRLGNKKPNKK